MLFFQKVTYEEILNKITNLGTSKLTQSKDTPFKIIKDNNVIFANFIDGKFPDQLKKHKAVLALKKETIMIKPTIN